MAVVLFLIQLFAGCVEGGAVGYYYVVAAVGGGVEYGFVFAEEEGRNAGGETAEGGRGGDVGAVDEGGGSGAGGDGGGLWERAEGREAVVGGGGGDVVPGAGVC